MAGGKGLLPVSLTDVTYIRTSQGFLYCSAIKDCFDGSIVNANLSKYNSVGLVINTIKNAVKNENFNDKLLLHSDQGMQYTSKQYALTTKECGIKPSMSRLGNCWDNAPIESFFGAMKCECLNLKKITTFEEAEKLVYWYLDFYNNYRVQLKSKLTPLEKRRNFFSQLAEKGNMNNY